jgi:hypothetical protein
LLGTIEGSRLGIVLGTIDGSPLGSRVFGILDESSLGTKLGAILDNELETTLAEPLGSPLGLELGSNEGALLGSTVFVAICISDFVLFLLLLLVVAKRKGIKGSCERSVDLYIVFFCFFLLVHYFNEGCIVCFVLFPPRKLHCIQFGFNSRYKISTIIYDINLPPNATTPTTCTTTPRSHPVVSFIIGICYCVHFDFPIHLRYYLHRLR